MPTPPPALMEQIEVSQAQLNNLRKLLIRKGIDGIDASTPEGRQIHELMDELVAGANPKLPKVAARMIAGQVISALLISRSAMTHLMLIRRPPTSPTPAGEAKRKSLNMAVNMFSKSASVIMAGVKALGYDSNNPAPEGLEDVLREIRAKSVTPAG